MTLGKICTKCKTEKELIAFSSNKKTKDKKHTWCKSCINTQRRENKEKYAKTTRAWYSLNKEEINNKVREKRATPEGKQKKAEYDKAYRERHPEAKVRNYYLNHERTKELKRQSYQRHKERYIAKAYERLYAIKNLTPPGVKREELEEFYKKAKELSLQTGIKHEVDHIIPISKGGLHTPENLQILPWLENRKKGNKLLEVAL